MKDSVFDAPPPGVGFSTVTVADPADAISNAGTVAVGEVEELNVVLNAAPFH